MTQGTNPQDDGRKIVLWQFDLALEGKVPDLKF